MIKNPIKKILQKTFEYFADQIIWEGLINNGKAMDFNWDNSARQYFSPYQKIFETTKTH